jgi:DNA-directed RNA polymerase specialized sigma24 family protein
MAANAKAQDRTPINAENALTGILTLLIDQRETRTEDDKDAPRTEVLLAQAGLSIEDIATVTGKKADTVRKAVTRDKAKTRA